MNLNYIEIFLIKLSLFSRFISIACSLFYDSIFEDYDMSTYLLMPADSSSANSFLFSFLKTFARWDSLYFCEIAQNGYKFDKNHVFFPFYPMSLKYLNTVTFGLVIQDKIVSLLMTAISLNIVLNCFNAILFHKLSNLIIRNPRLSLISTIIFIFNPSTIFFTAVYTESAFSFATIFSFYLFYSNLLHYEQKLDNYYNYFKILGVPMVILIISVFIRSNGLFFIAIPGYFILKNFIISLITKKTGKAIMMVLIGLVMIFLILIPYFIVVFIYPYLIYCSDIYELNNRPIWCFDSLPNIYEYNQKEHWNVTFLNQYRPSRITYIYWGMHSLLILGLLIFEFFKEKWLSFFTFGFYGEKKGEIYSEKWNPFMIYTVILFVISAFWAHTQSCTRFFASNPCFFWYMASKMFGNGYENEKKESPTNNKFILKNKWYLFYLIYFNVAGNEMFSNFLPWT